MLGLLGMIGFISQSGIRTHYPSITKSTNNGPRKITFKYTRLFILGFEVLSIKERFSSMPLPRKEWKVKHYVDLAYKLISK